MMEACLPLIAEVNHAVDTLGMYRAELARILCLKCYDISDSAHLESQIIKDTNVELLVKRFTYLYTLLENLHSGNTVAMAHWIRGENSILKTEPLLAMVDQGSLKMLLLSYINGWKT